MKNFTVVCYAACVLLLRYSRTVMCKVYARAAGVELHVDRSAFYTVFQKNDDILI